MNKIIPASPKFAKIERLGVKRDGANICIYIDGREAWITWQQAQFFLANSLGRAIQDAQRDDTAHQNIVKEIARGGR